MDKKNVTTAPAEGVKQKSILSVKKAAILLSFLGGFRMVIGLFCNVLVAMVFGASIKTDAYNIGIYLPMVLMYFCGLDLMRAILVSTFSKLDVDRKEEPSEVFSSVISMLGVVSLFVIGFGVIFAPLLVNIVAPGVIEVTTHLAINITRIAMLGVMLMMLGAMTSAVLLAYHEYAKSQVFDILSKFILTVAAIVCVFIPNIYILTFGFLGGQFIAAIVSLKLLSGFGLKYRARIHFSPVVREIIWQSIPVWIGIVVIYIATTVQRRYASTFQEGSIASLIYAQTIFAAISTMISVPLFRALSPRVARNVALEEYDKEAQFFWNCFKQGSCIAVILTSLIVLYSREIISVVFQRGAFDLQAVDVTSSLFTWIGLGVWGNIVSYQAAAIIYAHKKTHFSMILNIISSSIMCLILVLGVGRYGIKAIGMSHGISQTIRGLVATAIATYLLRYRFCNTGSWFIRFFFCSVISVAALMMYILFCPAGNAGFWSNILNLAGASATMISTFAVAGYLLKLEEVASLVNWVKSILSANLKKLSHRANKLQEQNNERF